MDERIRELARRSPNFGFLLDHEPLLVLDGTEAEAYVFSDPNTALFKARKFGETLATKLVAAGRIQVSGTSQNARLLALARDGVIGPSQRQQFDELRTVGNRAVHNHYGEVRAALDAVRACFSLGSWFYRTVTGDRAPTAFVPPRALIAAMVDCIRPGPDDTIVDPACGTGGFLLAAYEYIEQRYGTQLSPDQRDRLARETITGTELVDGTARLAAMNMLVHGVGKPNGPSLIEVRDSLAEPPRRYPSVVLANPPFGKKSSITVIGENGSKEREDISYARPDFWVTTTNKQLNFVQHIAAMLGIPGRAAVVVPDNVLFEGGAGETVRRRLLRQFDVHTLLRLPKGIFYAGGVKANVLFFDKKPARPDQPWTTTLWVYDFRGDQHFTLKQNRMQRQHLDYFVACYRPGEPRENREPTERFRPFTYDELTARDKVNLDITLVRDPSLDDADSLLPPDIISREIVEDLEAALSEFAAIAEALQRTRSITDRTAD